MSLSLAPFAKALRTALGIRTSENDIACLSYGVVNPTTGAVVSSALQTVIAATPTALAVASGDNVITLGSAAALTLAAPTAAQNGTFMRVISTTGFAHVLTATGLLFDGTSNTGKNTATFAAFNGASILLRAQGATWTVLAKNGVTVA